MNLELIATEKMMLFFHSQKMKSWNFLEGALSLTRGVFSLTRGALHLKAENHWATCVKCCITPLLIGVKTPGQLGPPVMRYLFIAFVYFLTFNGVFLLFRFVRPSEW